MSDFSYPPIHYPLPSSPPRTIDESLCEIKELIDRELVNDAQLFLSQVQRVVNTADTKRRAVIDRLWSKLNRPYPAQQDYYDELGGATNADNRPGDVLDILAEESSIPKRTNIPRKFTLRNDFKEKMMKIIFLTKKNHWYKLLDSDVEPSDADVYYWYGVLLDYRFDNKTGKLYEGMTENEIKALAQDFQNLAKEFFEMSQKYFKSKK